MTTWFNTRKTIDAKRLDEMYGHEDYYWYLYSPQFVDKFLSPLGSCIQLLGKYCLDVGCGRGWLCDWVGSIPYHGIDASDVAIKEAQRLHPNATFETARFEDYPDQSDRTFGTIVFGNMLWLHVDPSDYHVVLQRYASRFQANYLVVYDLQRLNTETIDAHFKFVHGFSGHADIPELEPVKRHRQVRIYSCD